MKSILFTLLLSFSLFASETPKEIVSKIFKLAAAQTIATDKAKQDLINKYIDFETMATGALGDRKKIISAADYKWFSKSLEEIITRSVYPEAPSFLKKVKITYRKAESGKVSSVVMSKGEETDVEYFFTKKSGIWKVIDIAIDMDSWVEGINEQVEESWEVEKWQGIKKKISKRLTELRRKK